MYQLTQSVLHECSFAGPLYGPDHDSNDPVSVYYIVSSVYCFQVGASEFS